MNKAQLVDVIAYSTKQTKSTTKKVLEAFLSTTAKSLAKGQRVALIGFGTFSVVKRKARIVPNPQNGTPIQIKARRVVKFHSGAGLLAKVK